MSKARVLFFSADPNSAGGRNPRLLLDEDVRQIREKVRMADLRDGLEFDHRWATRADDLIQALNEVHPQVVHFSGHGGSSGLVLASADGKRPHPVDAATLAKLFRVFRGDIKVVVLNACFSLPQARAIAEVVGCAIGTREAISDDAAITFGASFYRALAFGRSVQEAYDQASVALDLQHHADREYPVLECRPGVDPAQLFVVHPAAADHAPAPAMGLMPAGSAHAASAGDGFTVHVSVTPPRGMSLRPGAKWIVVAVAATALSSGAVFVHDAWARSRQQALARGDCAPVATARPFATLPPGVTATTTAGAPSGVAADLAAARDLYEAGNYDAAFPIFRHAADDGNAEARGYLGTMYLYGQGTRRDLEMALDLLRNAAGERDIHAMNTLAAAYERGDGVAASARWSLYWYDLAAKHGDPGAMRQLGEMYAEGRVVEQRDERQALELFRKAARAGSADALVDIGSMYENGRGTPANLRQARRCYRAAAEAGSARGMLALGLLYEKGKDYGAAAEWYRKGAAAGSADALNSLGVLYLAGRGVQRDSVAAVRLFRQAARAGSTVAAGNLARLRAS